MKKTRQTITPIVDTNKLCVCQNIPLSHNRDSTENHPQVGKVVLTSQEIFRNYYSIESKEGTKTLKTSFRMPHDILFQLRFFLRNFKANCDCDISYGFFMFYSMFSK